MGSWLRRNALLTLGLVLSVGAHLALFAALRAAPEPKRARPEVVEMTVVRPPPPEPPKLEPPKPEPPKPEKPRPIDLRKVKTVKLKTPPPPPPNTTAKPPPVEPSKPPPPVVAGLTNESFSGQSSVSAPTFGAGNTVMAQPSERMAKPEEVQPYQRPVDLADVTTEPVLVGRPSPDEVFGADYPPEAKAQGLEGVTRVKLLIDETGKVREVRGVKGPPVLQRAAEQLARRFRYKPATQNGRPVAVWWFEEIPFRITD